MIRRTGLIALVGLIAGCGNLGSRYVKAENVSSNGALIQVNANENAALAGTSLAIPAGALSRDTTVTVDLFNGSILANDLAAGPTVEWGPSGTTFAVPAEMLLPYTADAQDEIFVQVEEANGERFELAPSAVSVDVSRKLVRFRINGFTKFQAGARRQCASDTACASGKACRAGRCAATCTSNAQCGANQTCENGACQAEGTICVSNAQCLTNQACINNHCSAFEAIDAGASGEYDGGVCASNRECASNQLCIGGACVIQTCSANADCALGTACVSGVCSPVSDGGEVDLDAGIDLDAGVGGDGGMGASCVNNAQCGAAFYCGVDYQCHPITCSTNAQCGSGQVCQSGTCVLTDGGLDGGEFDGGELDGGLDGGKDDGGLDGGEYDGGVDEQDAGKGQTCRANFDCPQGQQCVQNICR